MGVKKLSDKYGLKYRYYVLAILTLTSMMNIGDRLVFSILMQDIKQEYTMTDTQLALLAGFAFALFYATLGIPIARLADKYNRKNIIAISLTFWSAMTALCGAATGFVTLFLARMGVGAGEAGGSPPSYSMIADYFKPSERTRAMGIYITGAVLGTAGGLIVGGALADSIGWRWTFVAMGVPGILLGAVLYLTVREPKRGNYDATPERDAKAAELKETLKSLRGNDVFIRISLSFALITMIGYAIAMWLAPVMLRNYEISTAQVGLILGLGFLAGGIPGPIVGSFLTERLMKHNPKWRAWFPAICILVCFACYACCLLSPNFWGFIGFFVVGYFVFMMPQGPTLSVLQDSLKPGERALGVSLGLFVNNILGQVVGLFVIGLMSDLMAPTFGSQSLNYAILILCAGVAVIGAASYLWTAAAMTGPKWDAEANTQTEPSDGVVSNG
ncbi:MAG: MFS transporter [Henriciella sp.]